ncbi:MAG: lipopolysaccharide transport periplasmic protein LptA [bacterium]
MNLRSWFLIWVCLVAAVGSSSCSLDKPIQSPKGKNADELYKQGTSQLEQKNYRQAIETFYKLKYDFPSEAAAVMADLKIADAHYSNKEYAEAAEGYEEVRKMHPASPYIPYVVYMLGMCHYHRSLSVDRDQSETEKALAEFHYLLTHFPDTPYAYDAYQKAQECMKKLSDHEVYVGNFYFRMNKYQAAIQRYEAALSKYPNIALDEEVLFQLAEAYQAVKEPEKAARTLQVLSQQYPKGKYAQKAQKLLQGDLAHVALSPQQASSPPAPSQPKGSEKPVQAVASSSKELDVTVAPAESISGQEPAMAQEKEQLAKSMATQDTGPKSPRETAGPQDLSSQAIQTTPDTAKQTSPPKVEQASQGAMSEPPTYEQARVAKQSEALADAGSPEEGGQKESKSDMKPLEDHPKAEKAEETRPLSPERTKASSQEIRVASRQAVVETGPQVSSPKAAAARTEGQDKALAHESAGGNSGPGGKGKSSQAKEEGVGFGELRSDKPINITADRMDAFQRENRVIFEGNVVAQQEETYLYARKIVADMAPQEQGGGIRKVVAQDNVKITQNDRVATCDRAEFDHLRRTIELHGNPKIWQGKDWIDGEKVLVQLDQEKMTVVGSEEKRVSAVLHPKSQKGDKEEAQGSKEPKSRPGLSAPFAQVASQEPKAPKEPSQELASASSPTLSGKPAASSAPQKPGKDLESKETQPAQDAAPPQAAAVSAPSLRAEEEAARIAASSTAPSQKAIKEVSAPKGSSPGTSGSGIPTESAASFVERWRKAWQSRDIDAYMEFYSKKFKSGTMDWKGWRAYKAATFKKAQSIQVSTEGLESKKLGDKLRISFLQHYRADHHQDKGRKELELINENGQWKIVAETWKPTQS